ncbi:hypothetical protein KKC52_09970 [bacterium]|nr:hypothetical protein [bacterium]
MKEIYELEKWIWTNEDFDQMGWHDSNIYSFAFYPEQLEFALDIDYIFKWVHPKSGGKYFKFWISPVTMVFENIYDLVMDIDTISGLEIDDINRDNPQKPRNAQYIGKQTEWSWNIECHQGLISLKPVGFKMFVNSAPVLSKNQSLGLESRGGINFTRGKTQT